VKYRDTVHWRRYNIFNLNKRNHLISIIAVLAVAALLIVSCGQADNGGIAPSLERDALSAKAAASAENPRSISVNGSGVASAAPDLATIQLGVESRSASASAAAQDNTGKMNNVIAKIKALGVEDKDIQRLKKHLAQMERLHDRRDRFDYFRMNGEFHRLLVALAANSVLLTPYTTLASQIQRARYVAIHSQSHWDRGIKEHQEILAALEAKDGVRLGQLLMEHSRETGQRVQKFLSNGTAVTHVEPSL